MDTYDVVVIGAGIIGCAAAYELKKQGKKTLLVEQVCKKKLFNPNLSQTPN